MLLLLPALFQSFGRVEPGSREALSAPIYGGQIMGIDFIRKAAPSFRKALDRRRIELATPSLAS